VPIISVFFGIVVRLYQGDHNPPHFHAAYGEFEAVIEIKTGRIVGGKLPPKAKKLVEEWRRKYVTELSKAWDVAVEYKVPKKIKGLE